MARLLSFLILLLLPQTVSAAWHEARSDHFVIYSNDSAEDIRDFAARLEQFDSALRMVMRVAPMPGSASSRVTIYVVDDFADIRRLAGNASIAGFMQNRASGSIAFVPRQGAYGKYALNSQTVLLHEYTHHFMYQSWGNTVFPLWFSEGFAELFATARFKEDGTMLLGAAPGYRAWDMLGSTILPAQTMLKLNPGRMTGAQMSILYARGWLAMHYLMMHSERSGQLQAYMRAINSGKGSDTAIAVFGDPTEFDRALTRYSRQSRLPALTVRQSFDAATVAVRPLTAGEAATMDVVIRTAHGVDDKTGPLVATAARKAAAPYPDDAGAQNALAEAEYDVENFVAAEAAADRALRADPKSVHAMIYKARAMQARIAAKSDASEAEWKEVRRGFLAANRIDPEYAWPLILYYESFAAAGQPATDNATAGLLYAHALAPFDYGLRTQATRLLIDQGKLPEAHAAIAPIAYSAERTAGTRDWALGIMAALDAKDGDAAIVAMNRTPIEPVEDVVKGKD